MRTKQENHFFLPSFAAVYIVPGSLGCGSVVLAAITMFAPSLAAFSAMAFPIPRLAPVINSVLPANFLPNKKRKQFCSSKVG